MKNKYFRNKKIVGYTTYIIELYKHYCNSRFLLKDIKTVANRW